MKITSTAMALVTILMFAAPAFAKDTGKAKASGAAGSCRQKSECCKVCTKGHACGDNCISASKTCNKGQGCACDAAQICK